MPKIKVEHDLCIGCGNCESMCPQTFKIVEGKSTVIADECGDCDCQAVIDSCPVSAISME